MDKTKFSYEQIEAGVDTIILEINGKYIDGMEVNIIDKYKLNINLINKRIEETYC